MVVVIIVFLGNCDGICGRVVVEARNCGVCGCGGRENFM